MDANRPENVASSKLIDLLNLRLPDEENQIERDTVSKIETGIKRQFGINKFQPSGRLTLD